MHYNVYNSVENDYDSVKACYELSDDICHCSDNHNHNINSWTIKNAIIVN